MSEYEFNLTNEEQKTVRASIRQTSIIALALLVSVAVYAVISYFIKPELNISLTLLKKLYFVFNAIAVLFIFLILGIRRFIYFSPRIIGKNFEISRIITSWRSIDILFLALAESIAILGLSITLMGISFDRSFHFFVTSGLLLLILLPMEMKFMKRIKALKNNQNEPMC